MKPQRHGILAAGNFIADYVKLIDSYPRQDTLASILDESKSNGGGPYNVLRDLAAMGADYPLTACGLVDDDDNGRWIRDDLAGHGIDTAQLHDQPGRSTSYTDAMTVAGTGRRTFFHQRGANAHFDAGHCDLSRSGARIFHLAYLMLLDRLDEIGPDGRNGASRLLEMAIREGMVTAVDIASAEHPRFRDIVSIALPWTDYLIVNELEAARTIGTAVAADNAAELEQAATAILKFGVRRAVIIHTRFGAVAVSRTDGTVVQAALARPPAFIQGGTGAGDAFAAGVLHGLHQGTLFEECLHLGICTATASLTHLAPSLGLRPVNECLELANQFNRVSFDGCPQRTPAAIPSPG